MRSRALRAVLTATLLSALLGGCAPLLRGPAPAPAAPPADFPEGYYRAALAQGKPVFRVDPAESLVVIEVRRSVSLARLGHDHVVASREVVGYVAPDAGRAEMNVAGRLAFNQSDFGITPYSLLGGAIAVKDALELRFRIRARRLSSAG